MRKAAALFLLSLFIFICGCGGARTKSTDMYKKAVSLQREGKEDAALKTLQKAIEVYPKNIPAHQKYQDILISEGKRDQVLSEYRQKTTESPREASYQYLYGRLLGWEKGRSYFEKSILLNRKFAWGYYGLGLSCLKEGKISDAAQELEKALELDPEIAEAHLQLGRAYAMLGRLGEAEQEFKKVVEIDPGNADGYFYVGNISLITGNINEAEESYKKALELDPKSLKAQGAMGKVYLLRGKTQDAINIFRKVLKDTPDDPWAHINLGRALFLNEQRNEGIKCFKEALLLKHDMPELHYLLALAYMDTHQWEDARRELAITQRYKKNFPGIHKALALIDLSNGKEYEAEAELAAEEKQNSHDPETYYIRGQILYRRFQILKAEEQFKKALSIDSRYYPAYLGLGQIEEYFNEFGRAVKVYEEALVIFPDDIEITYRMARCYSLWGQDKPAIEYLGKSLELGMNDWGRIDNDKAIQGMKYMPEVSGLLDKYRKKPGKVAKTRHSELMSNYDLIYNQINSAYRKI